MMVTTTKEGDRLKAYYSDQIKQAIEDVIKNRQANIHEAKESDFCVFVRENGYMVMFKDVYKKLSKKNKKLIERSYEYRQIED